MRRRAWTSAVVSAALLGTAPVLAGCGAGATAATQRVYGPSDGVQARLGTLSLLNVLIAAPARPAPKGATDTAPAPTSGGSAVGVAALTIVNNGAVADELTMVDAGDAGSAQLSGPKGIAARASLAVGGPAPTQVIVGGLRRSPGEYVPLTLTFTVAGRVTLQVPVVTASEEYAGLTPPAVPSTG